MATTPWWKIKIPQHLRSKSKAAYKPGATWAQIHTELKAITKRGRYKGFNPDRADAIATYRRNLARRQKSKSARPGTRRAAAVRGKVATRARPATQRRNVGKRTGTYAGRRGGWLKGQGGKFVGSRGR